jgi:hypothetical protein
MRRAPGVRRALVVRQSMEDTMISHARLALLSLAAILVTSQQALAQVDTAAAGTPRAEYAAADDPPLMGDAYQRATAAALEFTKGGTVTETEAEGRGGSEVEVRLSDGRQVEVQLDPNYAVVFSEPDDGPSDREDGPDDD